jgi:phosphohistidine phosphatase SixA
MTSSSHPRDRSNLIIAFLGGITLCAAVVFLSSVWVNAKASGAAGGKIDLKGDTTGNPDAASPFRDPFEMAQALKKGGYLLYFRHPERQKWDSVIAFDVHEAAVGKDAAKTSYSDAVCLTPRGKEEAKMIGQVFALAGIPVGTVAASPICRARQTAQLAFGRIDIINHGLIHTPVANKSNAQEFKQELKHLLTTVKLNSGTNTIISAHENTIRNHPDLFVEGADLLKGPLVQETGLYVIQRDGAGGLHLLHKFMSLGDLAANGIMLSSTGAPIQSSIRPVSASRQP